jgi:hypothetical protein
VLGEFLHLAFCPDHSVQKRRERQGAFSGLLSRFFGNRFCTLHLLSQAVDIVSVLFGSLAKFFHTGQQLGYLGDVEGDGIERFAFWSLCLLVTRISRIAILFLTTAMESLAVPSVRKIAEPVILHVKSSSLLLGVEQTSCNDSVDSEWSKLLLRNA